MLVAVVDNGAIGETLGGGPHDRPRLESPRQGPIHCRRQARIPRVRPVRMPTWRDLLTERQMQRLAGDYASRFGYEACRDVTSILRACLRPSDIARSRDQGGREYNTPNRLFDVCHFSCV